MTVESLKECNKKILVQMAKDQGVVGWHAMRKDQLIRALAPVPTNGRKRVGDASTTAPTPTQTTATANGSAAKSARSSKPEANGSAAIGVAKAVAGRSKGSATTSASIDAAVGGDSASHANNGKQTAAANGVKLNGTNGSTRRPDRNGEDGKPLAPLPPRSLDHSCVKDRLVVIVRDPYWLQAYWELSRSTLARAQAALGQDWHGAKPILRLMDVSSEDTTSATERHIRDIEVHGGVNTWYIDVTSPPRSFRVDVGYLSRKGRFFVLARSNVVTTPKAGVSDTVDESWASPRGQFEKIYHQSGGGNPSNLSDDLRELFEDRLRRPLQSMSLQGLGLGGLGSSRKFHFEVDAELIVYGSTEPNAHVTIQGEPVPIRHDGSFTVRFSLPDCRQILPAVASSADGIEERTIVLAVERNTKELEPMIHDGNEL